MGLISAVRSQMPVAASTALPVHEAAARPPAQTAAPVTEPLRKNALPQPGSAAAAVASRLAERDESDHPAPEARAAAAADAAREAYIKASIAAGVSPLPLP